jgi:hypothetical protein
MAGIVASALLTRLGKSAAATGRHDRILKPFAEGLFNQMGSLKFISYVGADGFPQLVPVVQCQAADSRRLAFAPLAFGRELRRIEPGTEVAVFCLTMGMEDVLIRGTFRGFKRHRLVTLGTVDIEWVYNSMPPAHGQIYPPVPLEPVTEF